MKYLIFLMLLAAQIGAQVVNIGGRTVWSKPVKWGDSDDSTSSILFVGTALSRDSSSTWVATSDSCSTPVKLGNMTRPEAKLELSYDVRASSGNTDSTQAVIYVDSRYCPGSLEANCEDWVPAGRFRPDSTSRVQDIIYTYPTSSGVTWMPTRNVFDVPGGNQIRFCVDSYRTGGQTGDSTLFRSFIVRNSSIPSGGTPSSSGGGAGDASASNQTDGSQKTQIVDGSGNVIGATANALDVNIKSGAGSGGTAMTDDAAFTPATTSVTPIAGFADETSPDVVNEGDAGAVRMTLSRGLHVNLRDSAGTQLGTSTAPVRTDPTGTTTQPVSGTVTANAGTGTMAVSLASVPSHDVTNAGTFATQAAQSGTWTVQPGNTANTTAWLVTGTGGTFPITAASLPLPSGAATAANQSTEVGHLATLAGAVSGTEVQADILTLPALAAGTNNIGDVDVLTLPNVTLAAGTNTNEVVGDAAHDAAVSGNPVLTGFEARTSDGTAVANGDAVRAQSTIDGKQVTMPYSVLGTRWSYAAASGGIVNTTGVTIAAAAGAGVRNCLTAIDIENGHATVSTEVVVRDGASGTVMKRWWAQAGGGGISRPIPSPICGTANTLLEVAAITTGSAIYVNAEGYTSQE